MYLRVVHSQLIYMSKKVWMEILNEANDSSKLDF